MAKRQIAGGAWIGLKIDGKLIAMVSNASYDEDFQVQGANVINYLGPISYDSQGYQCTINIGTLVLIDKSNLKDLLPTRSDIQKDGKMPEHTMTFVETSTGQVFNSFSGVMLASDNLSVQPNQYVTSNLRFFAVERLQ